MDLAQNTVRWMHTYRRDKVIEALALNSAGDCVAVYNRDIRDGELSYGRKEGYIFTVRTADGMSLMPEAVKVKHSSSTDSAWLLRSDSMVFKDDGKILFAWRLFQGRFDKMESFQTEDNLQYEGKLRIA